MALSADQLIVFGEHIRANTDPVVDAAVDVGDHNAIAAWYNDQAAPSFWILKSGLSSEAVIASIDWPAEYQAIQNDMPTVNFLFLGDNYSPRSVGAREALNTVFTGAPNSKQSILDVSVRECNEYEKIFAQPTTGPGGGDGSAKAQSALAIVEGNTNSEEVRQALLVTA